MRVRYALIIGCLGLLTQLEAATPVISIEPSASVAVGQEVLFNASGSTGITNRVNCVYAWDFGDARCTGIKGVAVPHFYMRPGTFTVTLTLTDNGATTSVATSITVTGNYTRVPCRAAAPVLAMKFESSLNDSSGNALNGAWGTPGTGTFVDGIERKSLDVTGGRYATVTNFTRLNGKGAFTITFWAKRASLAAGTMLSLGNIFTMRVGTEDVLIGDVTAASGSSQAQAWYCGSLNTAWHHYALVYDGTMVRLFADGQERFFDDRCPKARTGSTGTASTALHIGSNSSGGSIFNGQIDEVRIFDRALTEREIGVGFELWHAEYESHTKLYVYAQIPGEITADASRRLKVVLSGNSASQTLVDKNGLVAEEKFLLDKSGLAQGNYTVTAQLLTADGTVLDEVVESFAKPYNGLPACGLDENNAFRVNGELFFPVTTFSNNDEVIPTWGQNHYVNVALGKGFWPTAATVGAWTNYMNIAQQAGLYSMGPLRWNNDGEWKNFNVAIMDSFINASKNHSTMLGYAWGDEPDLYGTPGTALRAMHYRCHAQDSRHLTAINFAGSTWQGTGTYGEGLRRANYNFLHNANQCGKKVLVHDIYSFDYYPIEWAAPSPKHAKMTDYVDIIDNLRTENYDLAPLLSYVETCDIHETDWGTSTYSTPWHPTPGQLRMMTWLNVVHGVKGISWFPYHAGTPAINYPIMTQFVNQTAKLAPALLGPEIDAGVTCAVSNARIDFTQRLYNDTLFVFAVRVSEQDTLGASVGALQTATFTLPTVVTAASGAVFDEGRNVSISSHAFTDTFSVNSVHIYKIVAPQIAVRDAGVRPFRTTQAILSVTPHPGTTGKLISIRTAPGVAAVTVHRADGSMVAMLPAPAGLVRWMAPEAGLYFVRTAGSKDRTLPMLIVK
jgi:PKD repeat protein